MFALSAVANAVTVELISHSRTNTAGGTSTPTVGSDQVTDLVIDTRFTNSASAAAYACIEGDFVATVGGHFCGQYDFGANFIDESTTVWLFGSALGLLGWVRR